MLRTASTRSFPSRFKAHTTLRPKELEKLEEGITEPIYLEPTTPTGNIYTSSKLPLPPPPPPPLPSTNKPNKDENILYENAGALRVPMLKTY